MLKAGLFCKKFTAFVCVNLVKIFRLILDFSASLLFKAQVHEILNIGVVGEGGGGVEVVVGVGSGSVPTKCFICTESIL